MSLSWKDGVGTLLVGLAGIISYARIKGFDWPILNSWRLGTLALFIVGIASCIVIGSGTVPEKNAWTITASVLGGVAGGLVLIGLITGSKWAFLALATDILLLWLLTTLDHLIAKPA
jgi:hypothetical protein